MKTEDFDDALRRKLEGIHYQYKEDDIEKIHRHVSLQQGDSWLKGRRLRWLFAGSAVVVLITALLSWNLMLQHRQKQLSAEVDTLQIQLAQSKRELSMNKITPAAAQASPAAANATMASKEANATQNTSVENSMTERSSASTTPEVINHSNEGTSFNGTTNKNTSTNGLSTANTPGVNARSNKPAPTAFNSTQTHTNTSRNTLQKPGSVHETAGNTTRNTERTEQPLTQNQNSSTNSSQEGSNLQSNTISPQHTNNNNNIASGSVEGQNNTQSNSPKESNTIASGNNSGNVTPTIPDNSADNQSNTISTGNSIDNTAQNKDTVNSKSLLNANINQPGNTARHYTIKDPQAAASTAIHKKKAGDTAQLANATIKGKSSAESKKEQDKSSAVSNWHFLAGVGAERGNNRTGLSLLGEAFFSERWSVYSGIQFTNVGRPRDMDDDRFRHPGNPYQINPYDTSISHIDVRYSVLQLPIILTYHLPLQHHLALLFSAGTELDLYSQRHLEYDHASFTSGYEKSVTDQAVQGPVFNNAIIAVGIQKNWKHFTIDASPYISPQITNEEYRQRDLNFGIKLRGMYSF